MSLFKYILNTDKIKALFERPDANEQAFLDATKPRDPTEIATPEETQRATEHLKVARALLLEFNSAKDNQAQLYQLEVISKRLRQARALDPHATIEDRPQDDLAAEVLYLESVLYENQANASEINRINNISANRANMARSKRYAEQKKEEVKLALNAIERALRYRPNTVLYLCQGAKLYDRSGNTQEAKRLIERAYELDPTNIEVLKLR